MCQSIEEGGRRCRRRTHLERLTYSDLAPVSQDDRPEVAWGEDEADGAKLYAEYPPGIAGEAIALVAEAQVREKATTDALIRVSAEVPDCRLAGLEWRMKSPRSLARKLDKKSWMYRSPDLASLARVGATVTDLLRYTVVSRRHERLGSSVVAVVRALEQQGLHLREAESMYVEGNPYKGFHLLVEDTAGNLSEVQVHSELSLAIKEKAHPLYEVSRDGNRSRSERRDADRQLRKLYAGVSTPSDLPAELGKVKVKTKEYPCLR